ncbi:MAG: hypothetical protein V4519_00945 [Patescibacteria group bacterium]
MHRFKDIPEPYASWGWHEVGEVIEIIRRFRADERGVMGVHPNDPDELYSEFINCNPNEMGLTTYTPETGKVVNFPHERTPGEFKTTHFVPARWFTMIRLSLHMQDE